MLRIRLSPGFLFRPLTKSNEIGSSCLEPPAVQARLNFYASMLTQRLTSGHYTLHGFRSGAAVSAFVKLWIMLVGGVVKRPCIILN